MVGCVAVQSVVPLASRRWEVLLANRPVGRWSESDPASVSLLTPAALGVLKARRDGLLSGMGLPCLTSYLGDAVGKQVLAALVVKACGSG